MSDLIEQQSTVDSESVLGQIAEATGGSATLHQIKDQNGNVVHAFGTMSFPLRKDHWIYDKGPNNFNAPPMPFRMGAKSAFFLALDHEDIGSLIKSGEQHLPALRLTREQFADAIRVAGRYAVRSATMNGSEMDFDPDALVQNLVVGFLGYRTADGFTDDAWANPEQPWTPPEPKTSSPCTADGCSSAQSDPSLTEKAHLAAIDTTGEKAENLEL